MIKKILLPLIILLAMVAFNLLFAQTSHKQTQIEKPQYLCDAKVADCTILPKGVCVKGGQCTDPGSNISQG